MKPAIRKAAAAAALIALAAQTATIGAQSLESSTRTKGKVLVIFSSESKITLKENIAHPTGFFLSEFMVPVRALINAGYEPVFANPAGSRPIMDKVSDGARWFGNSESEYRSIWNQCVSLGICSEDLIGARRPQTLASVIGSGLDQYAGVLVPGGHAPMEDLLKDPNMGEILRYFHFAGKPTALICHGPIALLSTLDNPAAFTAALETGDSAGITTHAEDWIYKGYSMTIFTTSEEKEEEPGSRNALGGFVKFYPDAALENAGGRVVRAEKWNSNVIQDRELITGQNPFSDTALASALVNALDARTASK